MAREDGTVSHNGKMPEERRVAILAAARRAVGRRGYSATSMRDIAKEAGVAQALLHYYYLTKEALLVAVVRAMLDEQLSRLRDELSVATEPRGRALAGIAAARDKTLGDRRQWRLFFEVLAADSRSGRGALASSFAQRRELVATVVAGTKGRDNAQTIALVVDALMLGLAAERLAGVPDADVAAAYELLVDLLDRAPAD